MELKKVIEALVFASQKPLSTKEIAAALRAAASSSEDLDVKAFGKTKEDAILALLEQIRDEVAGLDRAFLLLEKASGWQFVSNPDCGVWVRQLYPESKPARLSGPSLETLAIIAYRQPITRADIEAVRGVAVDGIVQTLLEKSLIRIAGRSEAPGRPLLYETTQAFLEHFGLKNLDQLPNSNELRRINLPTAESSQEAAPAGKQMMLGETAPAAQEQETTQPAETQVETDGAAVQVEEKVRDEAAPVEAETENPNA
jgi:segregation and condensation protein B